MKNICTSISMNIEILFLQNNHYSEYCIKCFVYIINYQKRAPDLFKKAKKNIYFPTSPFSDRAERHDLKLRVLLFIHLFFFPPFLKGRGKGKRITKSRHFKLCLSARSFFSFHLGEIKQGICPKDILKYINI